MFCLVHTVVHISPAGSEAGWSIVRSSHHVQVRQILRNLSCDWSINYQCCVLIGKYLGVLVQSHVTASVHAEVAVNLVALTNLNHGDVLYANIQFTILLEIDMIIFINIMKFDKI